MYGPNCDKKLTTGKIMKSKFEQGPYSNQSQSLVQNKCLSVNLKNITLKHCFNVAWLLKINEEKS